MNDLIERIVNDQLKNVMDTYVLNNINMIRFELSSTEFLSLRTIEKLPDQHWNWDFSYITQIVPTDFVDKYPNKPWHWYNMVYNSNVDLEFIIKHMDKHWDWFSVIKHSKFSLDDLEKYIDNPLISQNIFIRCDLTSEFCNKYLLDIDPDILCPRIGSPNALCNSQYNVNWSALSKNSHLDENLIKNNIHMGWNWNYLSVRCSFDIIKNNPNLPWNWSMVSDRTGLKKSVVLNNLNKPWNWPNVINKVTDIDTDFINRVFNKSWSWSHLTKRIQIPNEIINSYPHVDWNFETVLRHVDDLTIQTIRKFADKPWDLYFLCTDRRFKTIDICEIFFARFPKLVPKYLSEHSRLTPETILNYPSEHWNPRKIIENNKSLSSFSKYPQFEFECRIGVSTNISLTVENNRTASCSLPNVLAEYLDLDVSEYFDFTDACFEKHRDNLRWKVLVKIDISKHIKQNLIQMTQHPKRILQQLNKFQYNPGTEEYCYNYH